MKIIHILLNLLKTRGREFIKTLYRQILHREPSNNEYLAYRNKLQLKEKINIIAEIMQSKEAVNLYKKETQVLTKEKGPTITNIIKKSYQLNNSNYISFLYEQLLNRKPEQQELNSHLYFVEKGFPRVKLMTNFLLSDEFQTVCDSHIGSTHFVNNQSIHIGFFIDTPIDTGFEGEGIGRFVIRLIQAMLNKIEDVKVTVATNSQKYQDIKNTFQKLEEINVDRINVTKFVTVEQANEIIPVDIWIVPYIGIKSALSLKKPIIVVLHDLVYKHFDSYYQYNPKFCINLDQIIYQMANKASVVVSSSNFIREKDGLGYLKLPLDKTHVISLAPPVEEYDSYGLKDEGYFRKKYHLNNNYIVYPSIIRLHKNHPRLIEAFFKFSQSKEGLQSNLHLVITHHYMNQPFEQDIVRILNSYETLKNRIVFLGRIPSVDLPSLYKYAEGTIIPTLFEGSCPFQIIESLAMDTPVAMSNIEVVREVFESIDSFITFDPYSIDEIEIAIYNLWKNKEYILEEEKREAIKVFKRKWSNVATEYYSLAKKVLGLA